MPPLAETPSALCVTAAPNANDTIVNDENIFKKRKQEWKIPKRGYVFAFISSLVISGGQAGKYHFFLRSEHLRRTHIFIINWVVLFVASFIVTFLIARWYYKMKDKKNETLRREYWNK